MDIIEAKQSAINLLKTLITIPSYSREEVDLADYLQAYIESQGYNTGRIGNNVWIIGPDFDHSKPTLLLNSHIDTVKPSAGWELNPHAANLDNGRLYGLGSNDAGASLVSLLHVFFLLTQKSQPYNLIFAASAEEEIAEKGLMVVDCIAHGKSGHAARNEGVNAIYLAMKDVEWIQNAKLPLISDFLGPVKMTVTMIHAGTQHNVVPDECSFVIDVRTNEHYSNQEVFGILEDNLKSEIKARSFRLTSSGISPEKDIVKRGIELGLSCYGSPTLSDQAFMHFPSMKIGPGESSRSHTADEYIELQEIERGIDIYMQLLDGLVIEHFKE